MATVPLSYRRLFCRSMSCKNILLFLVILLVALVPLAVRYYHDSRDYEIQNLASKLEFFAERGASWINVTVIPGLTQPTHMQTPEYHEMVHTLSRIEQEFGVDNAGVIRRQANGQYTYIAAGESGSATVPPVDGALRNPCHPAVAAGDTAPNPGHPGRSSDRVSRNPCHPARDPSNVIRNPCNPALTIPGTLRNPCHPALASGRGTTRAERFIIGQPVPIHTWFPVAYKATNDTWLAGEMMHSQLFGGTSTVRSLTSSYRLTRP
jgi:hypothetical protein